MLSYWQNIPWKFHYHPISIEVGLPSYLLLSFLVYGEHICSLNWLVITDEEDAEYCSFETLLLTSFETLILTYEMFQSSTVMLCTFHAIWQSFKRDGYHLLPSKKSQNGKLIELTEVDKAWGEYTWHIIVFMILYSETYLFFMINSNIYLWDIPTSGLCVPN